MINQSIKQFLNTLIVENKQLAYGRICSNIDLIGKQITFGGTECIEISIYFHDEDHQIHAKIFDHKFEKIINISDITFLIIKDLELIQTLFENTIKELQGI